MSTYTPVPEVVSTVAATPSTEIGFGITFLIKDKPISLEMPDINQIKQGNFKFAMPAGERVGFDHLNDFYTGLTADFSFLPPIDWATQPEPISTMATFGLWISNFQINIENKALKTFGIDLMVDFHDWQVPGIPALKLVSTSLSVLYNADGQLMTLTAQPYGMQGLPATPMYAPALPVG
jgi:hypothetical protein